MAKCKPTETEGSPEPEALVSKDELGASPDPGSATTEVSLQGGSELSCYANLCQVVFSPEEVLLRFALRNLERPSEAQPVASIYMSLPHVKRLIAALVRSLLKHEKRYGEIEMDILRKLAESGEPIADEVGEDDDTN